MTGLEDLWAPVRLTLVLSGVTTAILVVLATPLSWWLARSQSRWREAVGGIVALPLVLPPTVIGFYLLLAFGPSGPGAVVAPLFGMRTLAFSFAGLVIGSILYSLPFMVHPLRGAFEAIEAETIEAAETLGARRAQVFWRVIVPLARPGYVTGIVLSFAHTMGEFGVVLMIGGNIPGETKVLSIAIYDYVERLQWTEAHILSGAMAVFGFLVVTALFMADRRASVVGLPASSKN